MTANDLSVREVDGLVYSYNSPEVTDQLYSFGSMLLDEAQKRAGQIEAKCAIVLGWATGILAFLFLQFQMAFTGKPRPFGMASALFSLAAVVSSFLAIRSREMWTWPSDKSWFLGKAMNAGADELKRYHVRVIHEVRQSHIVAIKTKSQLLLLAEVFLAVGAASLFAGLWLRLFA